MLTKVTDGDKLERVNERIDEIVRFEANGPNLKMIKPGTCTRSVSPLRAHARSNLKRNGDLLVATMLGEICSGRTFHRCVKFSPAD